MTLNSTDRRVIRHVERVLATATEQPSAKVAALVTRLVQLGLVTASRLPALHTHQTPTAKARPDPMDRREVARRAAAMAAQWQDRPAPAPGSRKPKRLVVANVRGGTVVGARVYQVKAAST